MNSIAKTGAHGSRRRSSFSALPADNGNERFVAFEKQASRLRERRTSQIIQRSVCGVQFDVFPQVYDTGVDTELMAESVEISRNERFLEVGCGTGAISILVGRRAMGGIGVDISSTAVANANHNATVLNVTNVLFYPSNVFDQVREHFDIVVCNPPYSCYPARDVVERMFWDPRDEMKRKLFAGAQARLRNTGRIYFGWANFKDVDEELPLRLAKKHGFTLRSARQRSSNSGKYSFLVLEFQKSTNRTYWS